MQIYKGCTLRIGVLWRQEYLVIDLHVLSACQLYPHRPQLPPLLLRPRALLLQRRFRNTPRLLKYSIEKCAQNSR